MSVAARRAAVLGKPIAHSLSPVIHNAGYAAAGLAGWSYTRIECAAAELPDLVAGLGPEWAGLSVTMPGKEVALAVAAEVSPVAAAVGAANTLVRRPDGTWYADNTDVSGMVDVLTTAGVREGGLGVVSGVGEVGVVPGAGGAVTVLGAGGTARAALAAAARLGATEVSVVARRTAAIDELAPVATALGLTLTAVSWTDAAALADANLLISTVPKGAADELAGVVRWRPGTVLFDAIYDPWPTPLAASAAAAGCRVVSGLDLLLAQAVGQFEQFTGVPAPRSAMAAALTAARAPRQ
ncbi:shikimate dehydrogenase [Micromonospora radicis]|uniref:Shikimate dehydrogenase n=1 Tax=Micromonospora radicis TaxID=1894971 RepID=A0A418MUB0_9ACTN|nr:shikimate dehydrogenase [Micromonospora radicis]RIV37792.1 shikimate dehydrogenase [Micromonospora radicis]